MNRAEVIAGALLDYSPTDEEGVFVNTSRQACEEAADLLTAVVPQPFETAPKDGSDFLAFSKEKKWWHIAHSEFRGLFVQVGGDNGFSADGKYFTYWLPMPPDPEDS